MSDLTQPALAASQITVDLDDTHQKIDGFGVAIPWMAYYLQHFDENGTGRDKILDLLFSPTKGAGFSIVRSMINCEQTPLRSPPTTRQIGQLFSRRKTRGIFRTMTTSCG